MSDKSISFQDLIEFQHSEQYQGSAKIFESYFLTEEERVENGTSIANVDISEITGNELTINYIHNRSRFRIGDTILLNEPSVIREKIADGYEMEIIDHHLRSQTMLLRRNFNSRNKIIPFKKGDKINIDQSINSTYVAVADVITKFKKFPGKQNTIINILNKNIQITKEVLNTKLADNIINTFSLTENQKNAFLSTIKQSPISAIQGPPGTGKTYLLAAIAIYFVLSGKHVIISALSHFAINNALNKCAIFLKQIKSPIAVIKISRNKNSDLHSNIHITDKAKNIPSYLKNSAFVMGLTAFKARADFPNGTDCIYILDEASQISIPYGVMNMFFGSRYIFIGDHKQLPPIIEYLSHKPILSKSIFEFINDNYPNIITMLEKTFRMNKELTFTPSTLFYNNRLTSTDSVKNKILIINNPILNKTLTKILEPNNPSITILLKHKYCSKHSEEEAIVTCAIIKELIINQNYDTKDIAIISPFRAQQELIRSLLYKMGKQFKISLNKILVDTVERMQGQEREIIIYNLTMSDPLKLSQTSDFLFNLNRFNVAITRAKSKRIIIGSRELLTAQTDNINTLKNINTICRFFHSETNIEIDDKEIENMREGTFF